MHPRPLSALIAASVLALTACDGETCPSGLVDMSGTCYDLQNDPGNCGGVGMPQRAMTSARPSDCCRMTGAR